MEELMIMRKRTKREIKISRDKEIEHRHEIRNYKRKSSLRYPGIWYYL